MEQKKINLKMSYDVPRQKTVIKKELPLEGSKDTSFDIYFDRSHIPHLFFQSFYTLLFGFYTCYAYNYSGTIFAPIFLHGICNTLQMPRFNYLSDYSLSKTKKNLISFAYIIGILSWVLLIKTYN